MSDDTNDKKKRDDDLLDDLNLEGLDDGEDVDFDALLEEIETSEKEDAEAAPPTAAGNRQPAGVEKSDGPAGVAAGGEGEGVDLDEASDLLTDDDFLELAPESGEESREASRAGSEERTDLLAELEQEAGEPEATAAGLGVEEEFSTGTDLLGEEDLEEAGAGEGAAREPARKGSEEPLLSEEDLLGEIAELKGPDELEPAPAEAEADAEEAAGAMAVPPAAGPEPGEAKEGEEKGAGGRRKTAGKGRGKKTPKTIGRKKGLEKPGVRKPLRAPKGRAREGREAKARKERTPKARPVAAGTSVVFICSECYEEYLLPASYSQETVTCPECLHVGKRPDEDFLRTVNVHKTGERKLLRATVTVALLLIAELAFFVWFKSPYNTSPTGQDPMWTYALLGSGGILFVLFLLLMVKHESNRWEVYF